jgi:RNA polymerase sigma-70 factor, ECF subfamily
MLRRYVTDDQLSGRPAEDRQNASSDSDDELVRSFLAGDKRSFALLMRRHEDRVFSLAMRMMGNRQDAMDATQEVFLQLLRKLDRYDSQAAFSTWLYRVASNVCYDLLRRRGRQPSPAPDTAADSVEDPHTDATLASVELRPELAKALARLHPDFRMVVILHDIEQMRYSDIADVLDIPIGTVKSRLSRARSDLGQSLRNLLPHDKRPT